MGSLCSSNPDSILTLCRIPFDLPAQALERAGGEDGIRTHGTVAGTRAFQARRIGHSRTSPLGIVEPSFRLVCIASLSVLMNLDKSGCRGTFARIFQGKASYHGPLWATRNTWVSIDQKIRGYRILPEMPFAALMIHEGLKIDDRERAS